MLASRGPSRAPNCNAGKTLYRYSHDVSRVHDWRSLPRRRRRPPHPHPEEEDQEGPAEDDGEHGDLDLEDWGPNAIIDKMTGGYIELPVRRIQKSPPKDEEPAQDEVEAGEDQGEAEAAEEQVEG
eukprot:8349025-Pyramimonas_sp.AAC.1